MKHSRRNVLLFVVMIFMMAMTLSVVSAQAEITPDVSAPTQQDGTLVYGQQLSLRGYVQIGHLDWQNGFYEYTANFLAEDGRVFELNMPISQAEALSGGQLVNLVGTYAGTTGRLQAFASGVINVVEVSSMAPRTQRFTGSLVYVNLLCDFSDFPSSGVAPANDPAYVNMFNNSGYGLDAYIREQSYDQADMDGSFSIGEWVRMPEASTWYPLNFPENPLFGQGMSTIAQDCVDAADSLVDFNTVDGINLILSENPYGQFAYGSGFFIDADGLTGFMPTTWNPPFAHDGEIVGHEMGHTFGLWHTAGNWNAPRFPYDTRWSIMSGGNSSQGACRQPTDECRATGMIAYQVDQLGWIANNLKVTGVDPSQGAETFVLERLRDPQSANLLYVEIPIPGTGDFYSLEVRQDGQNNADEFVPGTGVLITRVDPDATSTVGDTTTLLMDSDGNANTNANDAGAIWTVGEVFTDNANDIKISILSQPTATSFEIEVSTVTTVVDPEQPVRLYPADEDMITTGPDWPRFSFEAIPGIEWYNVWIGTSDYSQQALFEWYPADDFQTTPGICEAGVCTLPVDVYLTNGNYLWWMSYWSPTMQDINGYWNDTSFSVDFADPSVLNFTDPATTLPDSIEWVYDGATTWYQIWVGPADYSTSFFFEWIPADEVCDAMTCSLETSSYTFTPGDYEVWMELWGPGGYDMWAVNDAFGFTASDS